MPSRNEALQARDVMLRDVASMVMNPQVCTIKTSRWSLMEEVPLHSLPGPSSKTVSFRHPLSEFAHHPQKTDPAELPQTPSPTESEVSKPKQESPTRRRRRRKHARAPLLGSRCLLVGFCIFALLSTLAYLFYWHSQTDPLAQQDSPEPWAYWRWRKNDNGMPRILLWNRIMRPLSYDVSLPGIEERWSSHTIHCLHENARSGEAMCEITDNRTRFEWSDAVVFEAGRLNMLDLPRRSTKFPMWVLWVVTHPSPGSPMPLNIGGSDKYGIFPDGIRTRFNWTMGRRDDADIVVPYKLWRCDVPGDYVVANTAEDNRNALGHPTRTKEVAWIASGCETDAYRRMRARDRYLSYDKSEKWGHTLVDVDVFDKCGKGTCATTRDCVRKIAARYYFIVVRIQPDCFHSVYELIYDAFEYDLVPVVLAPPNTTLKVPYNSIVSSADIQKPGQLAAFLSALIDNPSEYERYFEWKKRCCLIPYREEICPLCQALHEKFPRKQAHIDAYDWWTAHNICRGYSPPLYGLDWAFLKADEPWL